MEKNITLASNACSKPFIIIRFHDLHASNIKKAMGEIISYHERDWLSPFFLVFASYVSLAFVWPSFFVSLVMVLAINLSLDFFVPHHVPPFHY